MTTTSERIKRFEGGRERDKGLMLLCFFFRVNGIFFIVCGRVGLCLLCVDYFAYGFFFLNIFKRGYL